MGKPVRFWLIYSDSAQEPERESCSGDVRFVSKMSVLCQKRVNSGGEFFDSYLRGTVKRKHHLSRMTPPTENVVVSERSDDNRLYAVSLRVLDVGYLFAFAELQ